MLLLAVFVRVGIVLRGRVGDKMDVSCPDFSGAPVALRLRNASSGRNPILVAGNKVDLLPRDLKPDRVRLVSEFEGFRLRHGPAYASP